MAVPSLDQFVEVTPAVALGEDAPIDLTGPADPSGYTLTATAAYHPYGPDLSLSGLTVSVVGGSTNVIRVTLSASAAAALSVDSATKKGTLYVELWRTDSGNRRPLRRLKIPFYQPGKAYP